MKKILALGLLTFAACTPAQWAQHACNTGYTPFAGSNNCVALEMEREDMLGRADMERGPMVVGWQAAPVIRVMP